MFYVAILLEHKNYIAISNFCPLSDVFTQRGLQAPIHSISVRKKGVC